MNRKLSLNWSLLPALLGLHISLDMLRKPGPEQEPEINQQLGSLHTPCDSLDLASGHLAGRVNAIAK